MSGSGVPAYDKVEAEGLMLAFGDHAKSLKISGIKNQVGNTLAAAGGLEAAVCAKMLRDGVVPGTARTSGMPMIVGLFLGSFALT